MDGWITIGTELETKSFDKQIGELEYELKQIEYELEHKKELNLDSRTIQEYETKVEKLKNRIISLREQQEKINNSDLINIKDSIDDIGNSVKNVVTKVTKWGLAIFGIRSAYNFVRQSVSTLSQYNNQIATDISYIRYAIASTLQPVIERIIQLVYKLLAYVGYLAKAWFNVDIFANASVSAFNKANKSASALKKTLAGFDEMNVLNDNGSVGALGGLPSMNLQDWKDVEIPAWLKWIEQHGEFIKNILILIGSAILALKFNLGLIGFAGLTIVITGIVNLVKDLKVYLSDPTWNNFSKVLADIGVTLAGFGIIFGLTNPIGQILLIIGAIVIAIADLIQNIETLKWLIENPSWENFGIALKRWLQSCGLLGKAVSLLINSTNEESKATNLLIEAENNLKRARDNVKTATDNYVRAVDNAEDALKRLKEAEEKTGISGEELYQKVQNGTLDYKNMTNQQKEVYKAYLNNINAQDELTYRTELLTESKKEEEKQSLLTELQTLDEAKAYDTYKEKVVKAFNEGKISAKEAKDLINSSMRSMSDESRKTFTQDLPNDIKSGLEPSKYQSAWSKFKNAWNNFFGGLASTIHIGTSGTYSGGGGRGFAKGGIAYYEPIKLASGAVINQPGQGVPLRTPVGGERGAEGILPLTDSQQMELLGASIGRHVNITANIPVYAYNRQVDRQIRKIQAEDDFAFNGG